MHLKFIFWIFTRNKVKVLCYSQNANLVMSHLFLVFLHSFVNDKVKSISLQPELCTSTITLPYCSQRKPENNHKYHKNNWYHFSFDFEVFYVVTWWCHCLLVKELFFFQLWRTQWKALLALILTCGFLCWSNHFVFFFVKKSKTFLLECKDKCLMIFLIEKFKEVNRW